MCNRFQEYYRRESYKCKFENFAWIRHILAVFSLSHGKWTNAKEKSEVSCRKEWKNFSLLQKMLYDIMKKVKNKKKEGFVWTQAGGCGRSGELGRDDRGGGFRGKGLVFRTNSSCGDCA